MTFETGARLGTLPKSPEPVAPGGVPLAFGSGVAAAGVAAAGVGALDDAVGVGPAGATWQAIAITLTKATTSLVRNMVP